MGKRQGLVHLYVGDGKGKTTAAAGLALRALGCGQSVLFAQFLKGGATGELAPLERLGAEILRAKTDGKFIFQMSGEERAALGRSHAEAFAVIYEKTRGGGFDMVVLDEVVDAVNCGLVPLEGLLELIRLRPYHTELVLTGRNPPGELAALCGYHTEFTCKEHPYRKGVAAREGVEF